LESPHLAVQNCNHSQRKSALYGDNWPWCRLYLKLRGYTVQAGGTVHAEGKYKLCYKCDPPLTILGDRLFRLPYGVRLTLTIPWKPRASYFLFRSEYTLLYWACEYATNQWNHMMLQAGRWFGEWD